MMPNNPITGRGQCPACNAEFEFEFATPEVANTESSAVIVVRHDDALRCSGCGVRLLLVLAGAQVNMGWKFLVSDDKPGTIITPSPSDWFKRRSN